MITVIRLIQFVLKRFELINIFEFEWCRWETECPQFMLAVVAGRFKLLRKHR